MFKSQRSYGLLITKELIFGFQILNLKVHFSASLNQKASKIMLNLTRPSKQYLNDKSLIDGQETALIF